jgi:hypothetical protein
MLYKYAALPNDVEPEERCFTAVRVDDAGTSTFVDAVKSFYLDIVTAGGRSTLFSNSIVQVTEITEEVLTLVMPHILFQIRDPEDLENFAEVFSAHQDVCDRFPELHIEVDMTSNMEEENIIELGKWTASETPHGRGFMSENVEKWFCAINLLPEATYVHMVFSTIWRDFRELRGLSNKFGVYKRFVTFQFRVAGLSENDLTFFKAQTMAAVRNVEVEAQLNINASRREELVKMGCRGFNQLRSDHVRQLD